MDLFNTSAQPNILPYDGEALYYGHILSIKEANQYLGELLATAEWKNDEAVIFGKHIVTKRQIAWYGNDNFLYTYSGTTKRAQLWTPQLLELKAKVEQITGTVFNSCLLNLYHDGDEGMGWHSDDEKSLGVNTVIASLSLGAERKFMFKHRVTRQSVSIVLEHGSLLVMKCTTQTNWLHALPKTKKVTRPRINLTFRTMI